ncbi:MAG: thioredoxin family protein [Gammaproteobacteria bacterium]|nr:thioredoxin family protein [Gammaproteobacteria bacterium]
MAAEAPPAEIGTRAPDFELPGTDGLLHRLRDLAGARGTVIAFICNHCPYVQAILPRLARDARELASIGVNVVAINANDAEAYPEDSFQRMVEIAPSLPFPYLHDESQAVARAYGAVCTPDFFGYDAKLELRYRGRLDASGRAPAPPGARRELFEAMRLVAESGHGPADQRAGIGCSIKWR